MIWGVISKIGKLLQLSKKRVLKSTKIIISSMFLRIICSNMLKNCMEKTTFVSSKVLCHLKISNAKSNVFSPSDWPASSPDLNPLDYFTWQYTWAKLGCTKHVTATGACRVHVLRKEISRCCEGLRWKE
jgi:hypothetical protein